MRFGKDKALAKEAVKVIGRGMNQIVGALRQIDYTDNSDRNLLLIDGMVRTLAYINASRHLASYFNTRLPDMEKRYKSERRRRDENIRKLKTQRYSITDEDVEGFFSGFMNNITSELGLKDEMAYEEFLVEEEKS